MNLRCMCSWYDAHMYDCLTVVRVRVKGKITRRRMEALKHVCLRKSLCTYSTCAEVKVQGGQYTLDHSCHLNTVS